MRKIFNITSALFVAMLIAAPSLASSTKRITGADIIEGINTFPNYLGGKGHFEKTVKGTTAYADTDTATMTIASPAVVTITSTTGLNVGDSFSFSTTGALPTGVTAATTYYITSIVSGTTFQFSATKGGTAVVSSGTQSGVHTFRPASPRTGTGGSPSLTCTRTTSSPLSGDGSLLITKGASDLEGEGCSIPFTIDSSSKGKVLQIGMDYILSSGTYTAGGAGQDSDLTVYIYDVTNGVVIQPTTYNFFSNSTTMPNTFVSNFQAPINSTSYRLILHVHTPSTSAWATKHDNLSVSPTQYQYNTVITDFQQWTPTFVGMGSVTTSSLWWRRVGSEEEMIGYWINGTVSGTTASITIPNGQSPDSTKIPVLQKVGEFVESAVSSNAKVVLGLGGQNTLNFSVVNTTNSPTVAQTGSTAFTSSATVSIHAYFPVQGWSVQQQTSDVADQRIVSMSSTSATLSVTTSDSTVIFPTIAKDSHGAYSSSTGIYTVPISGTYEVVSALSGGSSFSANDTLTAKIKKNGTTLYQETVQAYTTNARFVVPVSGIFDAIAGDQITIAAVRLGSTGTLDGTTGNSFNIKKIANPAQISSTETIAASYWVSSAFTANSTTPINFDSKEFDDHNAVSPSPTAWKFTAPAAGLYDVIAFLPNTATASYVNLRKNGVGYKSISYTNGSPSWGITSLRLNAGDYIDICPGSSTTYVGNASLATANANILIKRTGM